MGRVPLDGPFINDSDPDRRELVTVGRHDAKRDGLIVTEGVKPVVV
jgi:hypothetical protein